MKLPLDPGRILRARFYTETHRDACDGNGYRLRRSCAHGHLVACPLCDQDVRYRSLPHGVVQVRPHPRGRQ